MSASRPPRPRSPLSSTCPVLLSALMHCVCVRLNVCVCLCVSQCLCLCVSVSVCVFVSVCVCGYVCVCFCVFVCLCTCVSVSVSMCLYVSVYLCFCVCGCVCVCLPGCVCEFVCLSLSVCLRLSVCLHARLCLYVRVFPGSAIIVIRAVMPTAVGGEITVARRMRDAMPLQRDMHAPAASPSDRSTGAAPSPQVLQRHQPRGAVRRPRHGQLYGAGHCLSAADVGRLFRCLGRRQEHVRPLHRRLHLLGTRPLRCGYAARPPLQLPTHTHTHTHTHTPLLLLPRSAAPCTFPPGR